MKPPNNHVPDYVVELEGEDLVDELESSVRGMTRGKAEDLVEEYWTLPTVCWATIYDSDYMQESFRIKGDYLRDELKDSDLYVSYWGEKLAIPERVDDLQVDIPLQSYDGRYEYHQENMDEWYKSEGIRGSLDTE